MNSSQPTMGPEFSEPPKGLIAVFAIAAGAMVANIYYAQPLVAAIAPAIHVPPKLAGSIVSVTQLGFGLGLFSLVSLADLVENRKLVLVTVGVTIAGLIGAATATSLAPFFAASFLAGLGATGAQVLVPFAARLASPARQGRTLGNVMAGLLTGIMLARPAALFIAASLGWRAVFWLSGGLMVVIGGTLAKLMPRHEPKSGMHYGEILGSMARLFAALPVVRRRAAYQALMFAAFNLFWTTAPIALAERLGLGQRGIALFALAGSGGALAAPLAGRLADRGWGRTLTMAAMAAVAAAFAGTIWAVSAAAVAVLAVLAVLIDAAVQTNHIVSQRMIFGAPPETRGRVNAIYMTILFLGGAMGSFLGTLTYHWGGWTAAAGAGTAIGLLMLGLVATEGGWWRRRR